jgi:large subunit ribosomal protein L5
MSTLQRTYQKEIVQKLTADLGITNRMAVPKLVKIVINCGIGAEALKDKKIIEKVASQLAVISGQKPQITRAHKAISTFKLRAGDPVGLRITLRGSRMYDFFTRLVSVAIPRVRDFRGVTRKALDGHGNYTLGIAEQTIFPELEYTMVDKTRGFEITIVTTAKDNVQAIALLSALGMPFEKENQK